MKKTSFVSLGLVILAVALSSCRVGGKEPTPTPMSEQAFVPVVSVTGEVVPKIWATVSAQTGGVALEVLVEPGDEVAAGDPLVRIDPTDAQMAVRRAEAALEAAQGRLALLKARPRPEEIAVVEAQLKAAEASIEQAIAKRDQLKAGAIDAEIVAAQAQATSAQADRLAAYEFHEDTMKCYKVTLPDGTEQEICPLLGPMEEKARYRWQAAEEEMDAAEAQYAARAGEKDDRIRAAEAAVQAAEEQRDIAQAQMEQLKAGASEEEIASAQAAVQQAEASLAKAEVALERTEAQAPFAGTVGMVRMREGEFIAPSQPLVTLGDLSTLQVKTTDLDEIDVARVEVDQKVDVTFDALPDQLFTGRVTRVFPKAESNGGGVNYTAIVELEELNPAIRWGMTAFIDISVGR